MGNVTDGTASKAKGALAMTEAAEAYPSRPKFESVAMAPTGRSAGVRCRIDAQPHAKAK